MTVEELRKRLFDLPDDAEVLVSSDEEGNEFHALAVVSRSAAYKDGHYWEILHPDDVDEYDDVERVVVLWP